MSRSIVKLFSASVCLATLPLAAAVQAAIVEGTDRIGYYNTAQTKHIIDDDDCHNDPLIVLLSGCSNKKDVEQALEALNTFPSFKHILSIHLWQTTTQKSKKNLL